MQASILGALDGVPPSTVALWDAAPTFGVSRPWFTATEAAALPAGAQAVYVVCGAAALFPMMVWRGRLASMTTPYTWEYAPVSVVAADGTEFAAIAAAFGRACRAWPVVTIEALDARWNGLEPLITGLCDAGLVVRRFDHFGNWQEPVGGRDWATYLAARPSRLREVLRRRTRDIGATLNYEMLSAPSDVDRGIAAYEQVYARSWKVPEPYPAFGPALLRAAAADGALRLALLWRDGVPLAAQYWVLRGGAATVLKLAHDETARKLSPGTLLTAWAIRQLIEVDAVGRLDFGRGDDPYKEMWATERHQRIGLLAGAPWRPAGLVAIGRQVLGEMRRRLVTPVGAKETDT